MTTTNVCGHCRWRGRAQFSGLKWIVEKLDNVGYRGEAITLKSDQGPSIMALKTTVAAKRVGIATPIDSPVRESQSNGPVEQAVRTWQGQLRTIKRNYEENMGVKLPVPHPSMGQEKSC